MVRSERKFGPLSHLRVELDAGVTADILGIPSETATIVGVLMGVAAVTATRARKWREKRHAEESVHDVVVGVPAVVVNGIEIDPARPGLIHRMTTAEDHLVTMQTDVTTVKGQLAQAMGTLDRVARSVGDINLKITPNGGDTNNPGDVALRNESMLRALAKHVGMDIPDPGQIALPTAGGVSAEG